MDVIELKMSEWCTTPFGRYVEDRGSASAQYYRDVYLVPALKQQLDKQCYALVIVDMDDMYKGYEFTQAFLHELFGGLIIHHFFTSEDILGTLLIRCKDKDVVVDSFKFIINPYN